ncbi:metacaspase Pca1 [Achlya hypogyna]|uniref:Metacaspase Pca1 n=1 Tax=Achlya hypogyna TaxID=1202772 RepID=A0A1V9YPG9_ACHHY|nr:metacaspase Pca1 [Achlya hypogyna]
MSFLSKISNFVKDVAENPEHLQKIDSFIDEHVGSKTKNVTAAPAPTETWNHTDAHNEQSAKKALFIGINYFNSSAELRGCIKDVDNLSHFVQEKYGFPASSMRKLTDDGAGYGLPTRSNILENMRWLVQDAKAGDSLFLHYSGHGSQQDDKDGDEADGKDETICPVDYETAGMITDDEMHAILCAPLPAGVKLTAIFDCCHSGSVLDLPFTYSIDGNLQVHEQDNRAATAKKLVRAGLDFIRGDSASAKRNFTDAYSGFSAPPAPMAVADHAIEKQTTKGDIVLLSGCQDTQTSADAVIDGTATGAMSYAFIAAFKEHSTDITYQELLRALRGFMLSKYSQVPNLSAGRALRMDVKFSL